MTGTAKRKAEEDARKTTEEQARKRAEDEAARRLERKLRELKRDSTTAE